jgi:hypothetical protein
MDMIKAGLCLLGCMVFAVLAACVAKPDEPELESQPAENHAQETETPPNETDSWEMFADLSFKPAERKFQVHPDADEVTGHWAETLIAATEDAWQHATFVSKELGWSPRLCIPPPLGARGHVAVPSEAGTGNHSRKLYVLQLSHPEEYTTLADEQPLGQTILKHTWYPVEPGSMVKGDDGPLFVMHKAGEDIEGTDAGWIYAVFDTEGRLETAGKIQNCMGCHQDAEKDRMFGLPLTE